MTLRRFVVTAVVSAGGAYEGYTPELPRGGELISIRYVKTDYANGVDFDITSEDTGEDLWAQDNVNASVTVYPRAGVHSVAGAVALYAGAGEAVNDRIVLGADDRIKIVVANGGVSTTGAFHITIRD